MAYDQKYFEYQMGQLHGYATSPYGTMGARYRMEQPKPWSPPPQVEPEKYTAISALPNIGHDFKLSFKPSRPETEFERSIRLAREKAEALQRAEEQRRVRQLGIITRKPRLRLSLKGHVHSFLDDTGRPFLDGADEFRLGEVVPHKEHLRRLRRAYLSYWQDTLENACDSGRSDAIHCAKDAEERLTLAKSGLYVSPVNALGGGLMFALFRETRFFRWSRVNRIREHVVGLAEYDRRMLLFFRRGLSDKYAEKRIASLNGAEMVRTFLESPRTGFVKPRKGRQFRVPRKASSIQNKRLGLYI